MKAIISGESFQVKDCKGLSSLRGLMFDSMEDKDGAFIYANSIWMPFVRKELQLIFLDAGHRVTSVQEAVPITLDPRTWRFYKDKKAIYCLEAAKKTKARKGMQIKILE